jgi:hypothetical protein
MHTVKVKSLRAGGYSPARYDAPIGIRTMTYAVENVPDDVASGTVAREIAKVTLAHSLDDPKGWVYDWTEIGNMPRGTIINRYKQARAH